MEGSPLRTAFKNLVAQVVAEQAQETTNNVPPEEGTVMSLGVDFNGNPDGTYIVQTNSGTFQTGSPEVLVIGTQVLVLTGDSGRKVSVPR